MLGQTAEGGRYLDWLTGLGSTTDAPLQVVYGIRGELETPQHERRDLYGYRGSLPVRTGNHAYRQRQHDALGYMLDCLWIHLDRGGEWRPGFWGLVKKAVEFVAGHWQQPGNSIWELAEEQHYLSGRVMCWAALDRAVRIAEKVGRAAETDDWAGLRDRIRADVLAHGWSDRLGAFRQRYEGDNLDAAALLVPLMGLLPADDPRVTATVDRITERLTVDGFVYRFDPADTPGVQGPPLGEFEGAFLPCTFWLAATHARAGRRAEAEAILRRAEAVAGPLGLFAEAVDPRTGTFLGNYPLLFSQAEYVRAVLALDRR